MYFLYNFCAVFYQRYFFEKRSLMFQHVLGYLHVFYILSAIELIHLNLISF